MAIAERDAEQGVTVKGAIFPLGIFDQIHLFTSVSFNDVDAYLKKSMETFTPPLGK